MHLLRIEVCSFHSDKLDIFKKSTKKDLLRYFVDHLLLIKLNQA